jgi:holo-[acyl-carrier protein] synthase
LSGQLPESLPHGGIVAGLVTPEEGGLRDDRSARLPVALVLRVGVDLTSVSDVEESVGRLGDGYLRRIFTEHEVASCRQQSVSFAASLAARFAAKEALIKVLRPTGSQPKWRDIEVRRLDSGACELVLHETAQAMAAAEGLEQFSLSMSHEDGMAVAVVVGWSWEGVPARDTGST